MGEPVDPRDLCLSARLEAVLDDGSRLLLLDGRGWTEAVRGPGAAQVSDVWSFASEQRIAEAARTVVGPDEPFDGHSQAFMERGHWDTLATAVRAHGVAADADGLRRLPHDVVLTDRLRARLPS